MRSVGRLERITPPLLICLLAAYAAPARPADGCADGGGCPVAVTEHVPVDGASLFLDVRGADVRAPLLVWLHGGPGGAERPLFRYFNGDLEQHFVVAYWDQRGAGHSFDPDADPARLTVNRHLADLDAVVDHLRSAYRQGRVILIGHSWGSALGLLYANRHPDKVAAVVGVAQFVSGLGAQQGQYAFVAAEARRRADEGLRRRLDTIGPPPFDADEVLDVQALVDELGGYFHRRPNRWGLLLKGMLGGYVAPWDMPGYIRANNVSLAAMHDELLALDLRQRVPAVDVPVVMMLGRFDHQLDARQAADYLAGLEAPAKRLLWFEHSAHNIPFEEPDAFDRQLVAVLRELGVAVP